MVVIRILLGLMIVGALLPSHMFMLVNKHMETKNFVLQIIWKILFFPIGLLVSPLILLFKTMTIWVLGETVLSNMKYGAKMFLTDITSDTERYSVRVALRRVKLFFELVHKGRERKVRFGKENPDKTFFVIRPYYFTERNELAKNGSVHLLFNYYRSLQFVAYAVENNMVPVVDWENYGRIPHREDFPINGTENPWEYYWNQPSEYSLEEVYKSEKVVLSDQNVKVFSYIPSSVFSGSLQSQALDYAQRCPKYDKYISLNQPTAEYIQEKQKLLFPEGARILGVSVRGTDYGKNRVANHPIQPETPQLLNEIHKAVKQWEMDCIFIVCEAKNVVDEVKREFGDRVLVLPRMRYEKAPTDGNNPLYVPGQRYQTNLDYLTDMMLLSRCDSLLAGMSGGVRAAIIWNANKYENIKIIDNGFW